MEVQAVNAVPARYDSQNEPWSAGDHSSAEPGAYRPGYELVAERILRLIGELALGHADPRAALRRALRFPVAGLRCAAG